MDTNQLIAIGSVLLTIAGFAFRAFKIGVARRPVFEREEREAFRKTLSLLGEASADYRNRLARLEGESVEARLNHTRLLDRLNNLESRLGDQAEW